MVYKLPIVLLHIAILTLAYTTPFWLDWRWIIVAAAIYALQSIVFGGCVLTMAQFKSRKTEVNFHEWLLSKLGFRVNRQKLSWFLRYVPIPVLSVALLWQEALHHKPWVNW